MVMDLYDLIEKKHEMNIIKGYCYYFGYQLKLNLTDNIIEFCGDYQSYVNLENRYFNSINAALKFIMTDLINLNDSDSLEDFKWELDYIKSLNLKGE